MPTCQEIQMLQPPLPWTTCKSTWTTSATLRSMTKMMRWRHTTSALRPGMRGSRSATGAGARTAMWPPAGSVLARCRTTSPRGPHPPRLRRARASTLPPSSRTGPAPLPPHLQLAEPPPRPAEPPRQPARIVRAVPARLAAGPSRVAEPPPLLPAGHKPRQPGPCPAEPLSAASLLPRCLERRTSWGPALVAGEPGETLAELPRTKLPAWDSAELGWCCAVSWPGQAGSLALGGGGALTWLARLTVVGCVAAFEKPVYALCLCDSCFSAGPIKAGGCCELAGNAA